MLDYSTVNCTVTLSVVDQEVPVKVMVYVPAGVFLANTTPVAAVALPSSLICIGKSTQTKRAGPPPQDSVTNPSNPFTDLRFKITPPTSPG